MRRARRGRSENGNVGPGALERLRSNYLQARNFVDPHHHGHQLLTSESSTTNSQQQESQEEEGTQIQNHKLEPKNDPKPFTPGQSATAMEWLEAQAVETFNTNRNAASAIVNPNFFADIEGEYRALFTFMGYIHQLRAIFDSGRGGDVRPQSNPPNRLDRYLPRFAALYARCPRVAEELQQICFTIFVHVFIKYHEAGFGEQAKTFLFKYSAHFKKPTQLPMLVSLQRVLATGELCKTLNNFKYGKLRTFVTEETLSLLMEWLVSEDKLTVLQIINTHVDFRILTYQQYVLYKSGKEYQVSGVSKPTEGSSESVEVSASSSSPSPSDPLYRFLKPPTPPLKPSTVNEEVKTEEKVELPSSSSPKPSPPKSQTPSPTFSPEYSQVLSAIQALREEEVDYPNLSEVDVVQLAFSDTDIASVGISSRLEKLAIGRENSTIALWDFTLADHLSYYSSRVLSHWSRVPVRKVPSEVSFRWLNYRAIAEEGFKKSDNFEEEFDSDEEEDEKPNSKISPQVLLGHSAPVYDLAYFTPSSLLLSASGDGSLKGWDLNSGSCLASYVGHPGPVWNVATASSAFEDSTGSSAPSAYHNFVSTGSGSSQEGTIYFWDVSRTVPVRLYSGGHRGEINAASFHPNGAYFATASEDKTVALWDASGSSVDCVRLFSGAHEDSILSLAFTSCGRFIASGGADGTVQLWDIGEGKAVQEFRSFRNSSSFSSIAWSSGGSRVLAGTGNMTGEGVHLWENPVAFGLTSKSPAYIHIDSSTASTSLNSQQKSLQTMLKLQFLSDRLVLAFSKPKLGGPVVCSGRSFLSPKKAVNGSINGGDGGDGQKEVMATSNGEERPSSASGFGESMSTFSLEEALSSFASEGGEKGVEVLEGQQFKTL